MTAINPQTKPCEPCARCGWKYPGFHVCIDMSDPRARQVILTPLQQIKNEKDRYSGIESDETRARKRDAANRYWASHHEKHKERNKEIISLYRDEIWSVRELSAHFTLDDRTVRAVLHRAEDQGVLTIRPAVRRSSLI